MTAKAFRIGDLTIHRIVEQEVGTRPALDFIAGLTPEILEENREWLEPHALLPGTMELAFCFQSYLVETPHHRVLVDTCIGNDKVRAPRRPAWHMKSDTRYMDALAAAGFTVADIDYVMCTHLHADHVGWNTRLDNGRWVPHSLMRATSCRMPSTSTSPASTRANPSTASGTACCRSSSRREPSSWQLPRARRPRAAAARAGAHDRPLRCLLRARRGCAAVMCGDLVSSPLLPARHPELCARVNFDYAQASATRRRVPRPLCRHQHALLHRAFSVAVVRAHLRVGVRFPVAVPGIW